MAEQKYENPHLKVRPYFFWKALIFVCAVAGVFLVIGFRIGRKNTTESTTVNTITSPIDRLQSSGTVATSTPTTDETADWKTYTNDTYGFSFKYPNTGWTLTEGATQTYPRAIVTVKSDTENPTKVWPGSGVHYFDQMIINKETETSVADWIRTRLATGTTDTSQTVTIKGAEYTEIVPGSDPNYLAELKINNNILYSIIFDWADSRTDITQTQEQILSTFQFTN